MLLNNTIDISAVTVRVTAERMKYVDYSYPIWTYQQVLMFARNENDNVYSFIFQPLTLDIWLVIFSILTITILTGCCIIYYKMRQTENVGFLTFLARIVCLPGCTSYNYWAIGEVQILVTAWAFASVILVTFYTGRMSSELAVPLRPKQAITSRFQLVGML
jgi:hypothetical protein